MNAAAAVDALLPQTQCRRCGYPCCRDYAEAVATGAAHINRCPPGGVEVIARLAVLLAREPLPLDPDCGAEMPPRVARIDEMRCIGCARCLPPCPVDAIVGAPRRLHTVLVELCTGCELCIAPCPVDCIEMVPLESPGRAPALPAAQASRERFEARNARIERRARERAELLATKKRAVSGALAPGA